MRTQNLAIDSFPIGVRRILENLEKMNLPLEPILRQIVPTEEEKKVLPCELIDPLGASEHCVTEHLIHQYKNRVLFLTTLKCFGYCRYCFRKNLTFETSGASKYASKDLPLQNAASQDASSKGANNDELEKIYQYLSQHDEIQEILFSGGDPLMLPNAALFDLIARIRQSRPKILIRICTRSLFFAPERFTDETIELLRSAKPLWIIPHINHPYEIDEKFAPNSVKAIEKILDAGISMQSQTVLLRGVNDNVETLSCLFENLTKLGIKPGYLFQLDLAKGISHFRVPIDEAVQLYEKLRSELSGLSLPTFAVDLPSGGGKFNLLQLESGNATTKVIKHDDKYEFVRGGKSYFYPRT